MIDYEYRSEVIRRQILQSEDTLLAAFECYKEFPVVISEIFNKRRELMYSTISCIPGLQELSGDDEKNFIFTSAEHTLLSISLNKHMSDKFGGIKLQLKSAKPWLQKMYLCVSWKDLPKDESSKESRQIRSYFNDSYCYGTSSPWFPWIMYLQEPWDSLLNPVALQDLMDTTKLTDLEWEILRLCKLLVKFADSSDQEKMLTHHTPLSLSTIL